ncbi:MAG: PEP-CTERM sorting domain-containing protein [Vicinamibacterales bacterium]
MREVLRFSALVAALALANAGSALAATITPYNSLAAWQAVAITDWGVDFNGLFGVDTSFTSSAVDVGPFSLQQTISTAATTRNRIEVAPALFPLESNGTDYAAILTDLDADRAVLMTFDSPLRAWGGVFTGALTSELTDLRLNFQAGGFTTLQLPADGFFGFTSDTAVSSIRLQSRNADGSIIGEGYGLDNVVGDTVPVPEPTTLLLLGSGLIAAVHRRRKA